MYDLVVYYREEINIDPKTHTLKDAFDSKYMRDLRRQFWRGERPIIVGIVGEKKTGKKSKRQYMLEKFKDEEVDYSSNNGVELKFLDLKLGNICNLKCRICGSWSSSKWAKEELDYSSDQQIIILQESG